MTRNHDKDFTFPATQGISPSSLVLLSDKASRYACPLKYKFEKVDGIKLTKWIMQCGTLFDDLCNSHGLPCLGLASTTPWTEWVKRLSVKDVHTIRSRYEAYRHHINYDTDWLQVPVWKEIYGEAPARALNLETGEEWEGMVPTRDSDNLLYLFGYVDRIKTELCERCCGQNNDTCPECNGRNRIPTKIIDHKLSEKPWPVKQRKDGTFSSTKAKATQGQAYIACVEAMYGVIVPMEFHVVNMTTPEIQIITYRPQKKSLKALDKIALDAIELRASGYFEPEPEEHKCEYCDHAARCAAYTAQNL